MLKEETKYLIIMMLILVTSTATIGACKYKNVYVPKNIETKGITVTQKDSDITYSIEGDLEETLSESALQKISKKIKEVNVEKIIIELYKNKN